MSNLRRAKRIDSNQPDIVEALEAIGASVELDHDDILVGYRGRTYWYEIKDPAKCLKKEGTWKKGALKPSQIRLQKEWKGHYRVVHSLYQIIEEITHVYKKDIIKGAGKASIIVKEIK